MDIMVHGLGKTVVIYGQYLLHLVLSQYETKKAKYMIAQRHQVSSADDGRKIIHIDMDAFFAAVGQRDHPELRGKPVVVGGSPNSRGVVSTCSYEARKFGIHSAMPTAHAYRLCPHAYFVRGRMSVYKSVSEQIRQIFREYASDIEPLSLDEAYLDVTHTQVFDNRAVKIAKAIRQQIYQETALTASAGISYNKFLAKIASDINKPDGQAVILPEQALDFIADLPVKKFFGVGKVTAEKMHSLGIMTGGDLRDWSIEKLRQHFGKVAGHYYNIARGIDHRAVKSSRVRKSVGTERTFAQDMSDAAVMLETLVTLAEKSYHETTEKGFLPHTMTIKVKYHDFTLITRSVSFSGPVTEPTLLKNQLQLLLRQTEVTSRPVRLLGVSFSRFVEVDIVDQLQQSLPL
jgi:DNA polymerase-4